MAGKKQYKKRINLNTPVSNGVQPVVNSAKESELADGGGRVKIETVAAGSISNRNETVKIGGNVSFEPEVTLKSKDHFVIIGIAVVFTTILYLCSYLV